MNFYEKLHEKITNGIKLLAVLIDPDKQNESDLILKVKKINNTDKVNFIFVGGSLLSTDIEKTISIIKQFTTKPVIIFPGSSFQLSKNADSILFLSLISGRNPEFLISNHITVAPFIKKNKLDAISTSYILIDGGKNSSVEYISNTKPIPRDKTDIAVSTAITGEMLGHKLCYLEAGSGAKLSIPLEMIKKVKENINIPLIIGGGIKNKEKIKDIFKAGADIIVIGNALEENDEMFF